MTRCVERSLRTVSGERIMCLFVYQFSPISSTCFRNILWELTQHREFMIHSKRGALIEQKMFRAGCRESFSNNIRKHVSNILLICYNAIKLDKQVCSKRNRNHFFSRKKRMSKVTIFHKWMNSYLMTLRTRNIWSCLTIYFRRMSNCSHFNLKLLLFPLLSSISYLTSESWWLWKYGTIFPDITAS